MSEERQQRTAREIVRGGNTRQQTTTNKQEPSRKREPNHQASSRHTRSAWPTIFLVGAILTQLGGITWCTNWEIDLETKYTNVRAEDYTAVYVKALGVSLVALLLAVTAVAIAVSDKQGK